MIRVDGKRLPTAQMLLHLLLQPERYSAIARTFNVIAGDPTPALHGCLDRCFKQRAGLGDQAGLGKLHVLDRKSVV